MNLHVVIDKAKRLGAVLSPPGQCVISVRIDGTPTHLMANAIAAFQSEIEDLFLRKTEVIGGGAGCLLVDIGLGPMAPEEERRMRDFFLDSDNMLYFSQRFGITAATVKRTPRYA